MSFFSFVSLYKAIIGAFCFIVFLEFSGTRLLFSLSSMLQQCLDNQSNHFFGYKIR